MPHEKTEPEPRLSRRIRTLKVGRVYYLDGIVSTDCTIRDLTNHGARLKFEHPFDGPDHLEFQLGFGEIVTARFECGVRWRRGNEIGVLFNEPHDVAPKII
jgi:two-component system cell cycle response regulator